MLRGLHHVTILVEQVGKAQRAYATLLGAAPTYRGQDRDLGTESALFGLDNGLVEVTGPRDGDERATGLQSHIAAHGEGAYGLAFSTENATQFCATARQAGLKAAPPQLGHALGEDGTTRQFSVVEISPRDSGGLPLTAVEHSDETRLRTRPAEATADPSRPHALDHVVIRTAQPERAIRLYGQQLGIRLALDTRMGSHRMLFFRLGGVTIEVIEDAALGEHDQLWGVAYRVRDLQRAHLRLSNAGLTVSTPRKGRKSGTEVFAVKSGTSNVPTLFIVDPSRDSRP